MQRSGSFERRSSVNQRPSPSPSPIPTPSSRTRTHSPSRGRPQSHRGRNKPSSSRPISRSRSRGRSSSRSSSCSPSRRKKRSDDHDYNGLFKTTAGLLAGIGVATVIAHKVWPKGVLHGDHEDWEHSPPPKHSRKQHRHRSPGNAERVYERTTRRHGDVIHHEEINRRRPQNYERMPQEHVRVRHHAERLSYAPDDYYIQEQPLYPAERRRTVAQPAPYPPNW
jgi:hypothetical protein